MNSITFISRTLWTVAVVFFSIGLLQAGNRRLQADADRLYAEDRCEEARPILEKLVDVDSPSGGNLYRLAYCQRLAGDGAVADATQARALEALENEFADAGSVETPFYLANTYRTLGRNDDMLRVAAETTELVEQGGIAAPTDGVAQFQLGKLYADQQMEPPARQWYSRAVDSLEREGLGTTYMRWAGRYLAERSWTDRDYEAVQRYLKIVTAGGEGAASDHEKLAIASARTGRYEQAAAAWNETARLDSTAANRARYGARLAEMSAAIGEMPASAPSGGSWDSLDKLGLQTLMREQADAVKAIQREAGEQELTRELRRAYGKRVTEHRRVFVRAAMEYANRGHSIREASFFGGYAPLILSSKSWVLPRVATAGKAADGGNGTQPRRKKKRRKKAKRPSGAQPG